MGTFFAKEHRSLWLGFVFWFRKFFTEAESFHKSWEKRTIVRDDQITRCKHGNEFSNMILEGGLWKKTDRVCRT